MKPYSVLTAFCQLLTSRLGDRPIDPIKLFPAFAGLAVAIAANLWVSGVLWNFYWNTPDGAIVRPMGEAMTCFLVAVCTLILATPLSIAGIIEGWLNRSNLSKLLGSIGLVLSLLPHPLWNVLYPWIIEQRHLFID